MKIKTASSERNIEKLCAIAAGARLYVQKYGFGYAGIEYYIKMNRGRIKKIAVAFDENDEPIGISIISSHPSYCLSGPKSCVQVFVRKSHRKKGIGSSLINKIRPTSEQRRYFATSSHRFFHKVKGFTQF